jgi:hypothetical protein
MKDWVFQNKEWIFSGIGVSFLIYLISPIIKALKRKNRPWLEVEIPHTSGSKSPGLPSPSNPRTIFVTEVLRFNEITWKYRIIIRNNSNEVAYSPSIKFIGEKRFDYIEELNPHEPIQQHGMVELSANFKKVIESKGREAIKISRPFFPDELVGLAFHINYTNSQKSKYKTKFRIVDNLSYNNQ